MKNLTRWAHRTAIACSAVLALGVLSAGARWQQDPSTQTLGGDNDVTREEVSNFDRFLDDHPSIAQQLQTKPALVNDAGYLRSQPDLQDYLNSHPRIRAELQENPNYFMGRENRFEGTEADRDRARIQNPNPDLNEREVGRMDQFLDEHRDIERELQQNPALIDDSNFLAQHQDLQAFLNAHPRVRAEFDENPSYFMQRENQFEGSAADRDRARMNTNPNPAPTNPNPDLTTQEVSRMDQFLDDHPDIEKQLEKKPSLIDDKGYLDHHKDLARFLDEHPQIRAEFDENPQFFMQRQNQFEGTAADRDRVRTSGGTTPAPANGAPPNPNPDLTTQEVSRMDQFLDDHPDIEEQLEKKPSLIDDKGYLDHHKDLARFLDEHPQIRAEFDENPQFFMQRQNQFEGTAADRDRVRTSGGTTPAPANGAPPNPNPDLTTQEVSRMDQFLDDHPDIEEQLEKKPSLIDDKGYLDHHKDLARFLDEHPQIRAEFAENPQFFMQRQNQFEGTAGDRDAVTTDRDRDRDLDLKDKDLADMDKFLDKHKSIAKDLDKEPSRANNAKYLDRHKDLRKFFDEHEQARTEFAQNPQHFMEREHEFQRHDSHRLENRRLDQGKDRKDNKNLDHRADTDHRIQL